MLIVDETGLLKKGHAVGGGAAPIHRHGGADRKQPGRGVSRLRHTIWAGVDRPPVVSTGETWCADAGRRARARIPADLTFATKPRLALEMITEALDAGIPTRWVTGGEVYGAGRHMRDQLERRDVGYVLAVACDHQISRAGTKARADAVAADLPASAWHRYSAGPGAKGPRFYDWAWTGIDDVTGTPC